MLKGPIEHNSRTQTDSDNRGGPHLTDVHVLSRPLAYTGRTVRIIRIRVLYAYIRDFSRGLTYSATLVCMHSGICQGMSWQHLHQACVAGTVYHFSRPSFPPVEDHTHLHIHYLQHVRPLQVQQTRTLSHARNSYKTNNNTNNNNTNATRTRREREKYCTYPATQG